MRGKFDVKKGSSGDPRFTINKAGSLNTQTELLLQRSRYAVTQLTEKFATFMTTKTSS
jgi:hypothetical protein